MGVADGRVKCWALPHGMGAAMLGFHKVRTPHHMTCVAAGGGRR